MNGARLLKRVFDISMERCPEHGVRRRPGGWPHGAAYYASKHGVVGMTKAAALEYADKACASMRWRLP